MPPQKKQKCPCGKFKVMSRHYDYCDMAKKAFPSLVDFYNEQESTHPPEPPHHHDDDNDDGPPLPAPDHSEDNELTDPRRHQVADHPDVDVLSVRSSSSEEEGSSDQESIEDGVAKYKGTVNLSEMVGEGSEDDRSIPGSIVYQHPSDDASDDLSQSVVDPRVSSSRDSAPPEVPIQIVIQQQHGKDLVIQDNNNPLKVTRKEEYLKLLGQFPHLGAIVDKPVNSPDYDMWKLEDDTTMSMLRLIDYCDQRSSSNRTFLDGLLKIVAEEMRFRNFQPALAPTRETVSRQIIGRYGVGTLPVVSSFRASSITNPYLLSDHNALHSRKRDILYCVTFSVEQNILDILNDREIFGNINNLVVNTKHPFSPYDGHGDEILGGSWYKETVIRMKEHLSFDEYYDFLLPIILYVDKTGTTDNQRYPLEPFIFTLAIIRRALRYHPRAWRPAGFIPDLESKSTYENKYTRSKNPAANPQSYHRFLELVLKGFQEVQDNGIVTWLRLGGQVKKCRIRPEIAFCIGDGKSADMITLRQGGHIQNAARISRSCHTNQANCDNVVPDCKFVTHQKEPFPEDTSCENLNSLLKASGLKATVDTLSEIAPMSCDQLQEFTEWRILQKSEKAKSPESRAESSDSESNDCDSDDSKSEDSELGDTDANKQPNSPPNFSDKYDTIIEEAKDTLKKHGFHPVRNAFLARCIRFGLDPRNIWGANPTDLMHAFQSGILMYLTKMALDKLGNKKRAQIDRLVERLLGHLRSSDRESFPRYSFTKGFAKVSMITSDEWAGKLFVLLLVLTTEEGKTILGNTFTKLNIKLPATIFEGSILQQSKDFQQVAATLDEAELNKNRTSSKGRKRKRMGDDELALPTEDPEWQPNMPGEEALRKCSFFDFIQLAEALLCFHAWYRLDAIEFFSGIKSDGDRQEISNSVRDSIRRLLSMLKCYMPRKTGNGWKIQKFHDILHLAVDMERFGSPKNFDAGPLESSLRFWAKFPAATAQTRGYNEFVRQVALRLHEYQCFFKARREAGIVGIRDRSLVDLDDDFLPRRCKAGHSDPDEEYRLGGSHYRVFASSTNDDHPPTVHLGTRSRKKKEALPLHEVIEEFLRKNLGHVDSPEYIPPSRDSVSGMLYWDIFTECRFPLVQNQHKLLGHHGQVNVRCHPDFKGEGPWYDWVIVDYTEDYQSQVNNPEETDHEFYPPGCVPAKVIAFVGNPDPNKHPLAIVHPCAYQSDADKALGSVLLEHWNLHFMPDLHSENHPYTVTAQLATTSIDAIVDRCFVMEESPGMKASVDLQVGIPTIGDNSKKQAVNPKRQAKINSSVKLVLHREFWGNNFT